jgi:hypothetical protein
MKRDLKSNIATVLLKEPVDDAGVDTVSNLLDTADCFGVEVDVIIGALTGTLGESNYLTPSLEECDTTEGDDFTAVAAADMIGSLSVVDAAAEDSVIQRVGYIGHKRYIRAKLDYTGTVTAGITGVVGILGFSKEAPVTAPAAVSAT